MSVLSFPRIYFKGYMEWDPCTFNNNDWQEFPTYDATNAALNWQFLATQNPPITPDNFTTTFRPWAIRLQEDAVDTPPGARIPAEWNMFGTHGVSFVQYNNLITTVTGGELDYNQPVTSDPLIGGPVAIGGDNGYGPGRLVDTNPVSPWSTQIYFGSLSFGSGSAGISGPRVYRMHSRWLNPNRIYSTDQFLTQPASSIGVCFQTCIPYAQVIWQDAGASPLITKLQQAASQPGALGIMVRFTAYVNVYFVNGIFNNTAAQPRDYETLAAIMASAWEAWNTSGDTSQFFSQPCYSHVVGAVGVWNEGELATVPGGRCLAAGTAVAPLAANAAAGNAASTAATHATAPHPPHIVGHELKMHPAAATGDPVALGPVAVNIDYTSNVISLDLSSTIPENGTPGQWPSDLSKADFGPLCLGVVTNNGFTPVVEIAYEQYARAAYEASAGIIDIPFPDAVTGPLLQSGPLVIQVQGQDALLEQVFTAETDTRGIYLDEQEQTEFQVTVFQVSMPSASTNLLIAKYDGNLNLIPSGQQQQYVNFTNGEQTTVTVPSGQTSVTTDVTIFETDQNGNATVGIAAQSPGFPVLAFLPFTGQTLPQPPLSFNFVDSAFYTTVRVLPFDDGVPAAFVNLWNSTQDKAQAWEFIYFQILYVYDMLFNVMLEFVNLGSQQAVEQNIRSIWSAISRESAAESTYAMPITRDLSAGKRLTLQLWIYLVANNYNVPGFNVNSIPNGWMPPK